MIPKQVEDAFFAGKRTANVRVVVNDAVRVTSGPHAGREGAVVSIVTLEPEVTLLVEPGSPPYGDIEVPQSLLALLT